MKKVLPGALLVVLSLLVIAGCKKTSPYPAVPLTDYYSPLKAGKYITYRLDSLNFYYYGQLDTTTSYLAKDSVEAAIADNLGRPAWRVVRYLNDVNGSGTWTPSETYVVVATSQAVEVVETNLRTIKLTFPVADGRDWSGNSYLPYDPYQDLFDFSDDSHLNLKAWDYTYQQVGKSLTLGNKVYDSTATIVQVNDSINAPVIIDPHSFASRTYWTETYAKNIGLVYRHAALWEYQPPTPNGNPNGYKIGFEVTLTILDHN